MACSAATLSMPRARRRGGCGSCGPGPAFLWHLGKSLEFKKTRVADGVTRVRAAANAARSQAACDLMTRSEEHMSELQSLMRISYTVFCLKKKTTHYITKSHTLEYLSNINKEHGS